MTDETRTVTETSAEHGRTLTDVVTSRTCGEPYTGATNFDSFSNGGKI